MIDYFGKKIDLNDIYYIYFKDGKKREMSEKQLQEYNNIGSMPDRLRFELLQKLDPSKNPNITPVTGRELLEITSKGYIPQFDLDFMQNKKLCLMPASALDFYLKYSQVYGGKR